MPYLPPLRRYQLKILNEVLGSTLRNEGLSYSVQMSRQAGKNEISAQLEAVLLSIYQHTGGTIINGGTLKVGNDKHLGDASNGIDLNGGTLAATDNLTTGRHITVNGGSIAIDSDATLTANGTIGGTGALTQNGGTLVLGGVNTYTGGANVTSGVVKVSKDANLGDAAGKVTLANSVLETTGNALWVSSLSFVEASTPGTGGFIDTAQQRLGVRHLSPIVTEEGLAQVPIEGSTLRLGDVATVVEDHQPLIGDALTNEGTGMLLVVEKFPGANTLEVTQGVEEALDAMRPGLTGIATVRAALRPARSQSPSCRSTTILSVLPTQPPQTRTKA